MQHNDDSPKPSRPSLLTPAQQAEADRHRILSQLETGKVGKPTTRRKGWKPVWIGAGVLALAVAVMAGLWINQDYESDAHIAAVSAAAAGTAAGAAPARPAASVDTTSASAAPSASGEVSSDEVLSSAAPAAVIQEDRAAQAQDKKQSLGEMLENNSEAAVSPAAGKHDPSMLSSALEKPSAGAAPQSPHKAAAKEKPKAKPATVAKAPRPKEKEKTSPEEENDIALLAALVAHTQSEERRAEPPKKPRLSLDEQLNQCKKLSKTKAAQCHERVCEGRSKTGGCKGKE